MTPEHRKSLAQSLDGNPLFHKLMDELHEAAVETLVYAKTEQERVEAQWRTRAIRELKNDVLRLIAEPSKRKGKIA